MAPSRTLVFDRQIKTFGSDHLEPLVREKIIRVARHREKTLYAARALKVYSPKDVERRSNDYLSMFVC